MARRGHRRRHRRHHHRAHHHRTHHHRRRRHHRSHRYHSGLTFGSVFTLGLALRRRRTNTATNTSDEASDISDSMIFCVLVVYILFILGLCMVLTVIILVAVMQGEGHVAGIVLLVIGLPLVIMGTATQCIVNKKLRERDENVENVSAYFIYCFKIIDRI